MLLTVVPSRAEPDYHTAPYGAGGTWNLYEVVGVTNGSVDTWYAAHSAAQAKLDPLGGSGASGHLVSIQSADENLVVHRFGGGAKLWIGLTDHESFGGTEAGTDPDGDWVWAGTSELFGYRQWSAGEPNDYGVGEDGVTMNEYGDWVDEQSNIPGSGQTDPRTYAYVIEWDTESPDPVPGAQLPQAAVATPFPGPIGGSGWFGLRVVRDNGTLKSIADAVASLQSGTGTVLDGTATVINHNDPDNPGAAGLFIDESVLPGDIPGSNDDNVAAVFRGHFEVPWSGDWTFGVHSDDGFALHIPGVAWSQAHGNGFIDPSNRSLLLYLYGTHDSDTRGVVHLEAGVHRIEFLSYDGEGGSTCELYAAPGAWESDDQSSGWRLIGSTAPAPLGIPGLLDAHGEGHGWLVETSPPDAPGTPSIRLDSLAMAESELAAGNTTSTWATVNFHDPDSGGTSLIPGDLPFPRDVVGQNDEDYALRATATLSIPLAGSYRFGFQSDDGGALRIAGQTWTRIVESATIMAYINGDRIEADLLTGNSRTIAEIYLDPGNYTVEALFFERGGDSNQEVFWVDHWNHPQLLATGTAGIEPHPHGLQLVDPPQPQIQSLEFPTAGHPRLHWKSLPGARYRLDQSPDLVIWSEIEPAIPSMGMDSEIEIPSATGPGPMFFRISDLEW